MKFLEFQKIARRWGVIDINNINAFAELDKRRLYEWQQKGYIKKLSSNFYLFADVEINEQVLRHIAGRLVNPSYLGLESALSYYNLIPEQVFQTVSITSLKTRHIKNGLNLKYVSLKKTLFWGYQSSGIEPYTYMISTLEKAIIDILYIRKELKTDDDYLGLRLNSEELNKQINLPRLTNYFKLLHNPGLVLRVKNLLRCYYAGT